eukprot:808225-Prorocentrum_minimum.AAC.1
MSIKTCDNYHLVHCAPDRVCHGSLHRAEVLVRARPCRLSLARYLRLRGASSSARGVNSHPA